MKIAVCYCYPMVKTLTYFPMARRFAQSYQSNPPGCDHGLFVICGGRAPAPNDLLPFQDIPCSFVSHSNEGWDIGAYQWACENLSCDLLVCLGAHVHFHHPGWLAEMAQAFIENGPGIYGCWGYDFPEWHIRTTAFWIPPELLRSYPYRIGSSRQSRYGFEHGRESITKFSLSAGMCAVMVTRKGRFHHPEWPDHIPGPEDSLVLDRFQDE